MKAYIIILLVLLLPLLGAHCVMKVRSLSALAVFELEKVRQLGPEEDDEVQKRDHRQNGIVPHAGGDVAGNVEEEIEHIDIRKPLHADGDDEEQQKLRLGV